MAGKPGRGGRPSKLTPEVQQRLCDAVRAGNYLVAACRYAGISQTRFGEWMRAGKAARSGKYRAFRAAVLKAKADCEVGIVAQWRQHMPETYAACRDFLGRRFPGRWGKKEKHEHTGPRGGPIPFSMEEAVRARKELEEWERARLAAPPGGAG